MRAEDPNPFRPRSNAWSPWWIVCAVVVGILIGMRLASGSIRFDWPWNKTTVGSQSTQDKLSEFASRPPHKPAVDQRDTPTLAVRQNGRAIEHPPPEIAPAPPLTREVYLCRDYGGAVFWSSALCSTQRATLERIATVPGHYSWEEAVAAAVRQKQAADELYKPSRVATTAGVIGRSAAPSGASGASAASGCALLAASIRRIDAATRQPLPASEQDRLRRERQAVRDREAALRC